jgi:hypothetical protein
MPVSGEPGCKRAGPIDEVPERILTESTLNT